MNTVAKNEKVQLVSILAIVFILFIAHQAAGDTDCYTEKKKSLRGYARIPSQFVVPMSLQMTYVGNMSAG